ncbi:MAG: prepilin-type N-terminal cleavage/methylation domain-containing protein [Gammaproteobacteria bacterium]|nr:prepilin-type N-terminal cleavage/methylation domain-containing protein [Gammaproteobacteria bacterium]
MNAMENPGRKKTGSVSARHNRQRGFTLFELVAYILVVAITASVAYNRFGDFPGEAERANFMAVMMQLKAGVNMRMMNGIASGNWDELRALEGSNPMDLMLETPTNYVGQLSVMDMDGMPARIWYFDPSTGELVYIANDATNLYVVMDEGRLQTDELRFRITMKYRSGDQQSWEGLVLEPTRHYEWGTIGLELPRQVTASVGR